jgi:hypothetical protein
MSDRPAPLADVVAEAHRVVSGAERSGVTARVLGGVGVALHDHGPVPSSLQRTYGDIDIVVPAKSTRATAAALTALGYVSNDRFNAVHGARRMLFYDEANSRQLDVFVGVFAMCHELDLGRRLSEHPVALDAADLLLTKLQIAEINHKDLVDGVRLVLTHELSTADAPAGRRPEGADELSVARLGSVTSADWGWYTTFTDNLDRLRGAAQELLTGADAASAVDRVDRLRTALEQSTKSLRWRARSVVGRKTPWYELPEEVNRGVMR